MKYYSITFSRNSLIRCIILICLFTALLFGGFTAAKSISAKATAADNTKLSYRSVSLCTDDTLWSVAREHYSKEWGSMSEYLDEIMRCNSLTSDEITAGSSLIVPVYVTP